MKYALLGLLGLTTLSGCAKYPANFTPDATHVIFSMTVRGQIRSDYVYIIPIRVSMDVNPTGDGPIPIIAFPTTSTPIGFNGFVTGNVDYFVVWTPDTQQYTLYRFNDNSLTLFTAVGFPLNTVTVSPGSKTIGFELSLDQILGPATTASALQSIQVNFLTMNYRLTPGTSPSGRIIDCLGNTNSLLDLNEPVKIPLQTAGLYDNARFNLLEPPEADCADPDLDITDWSIEVRPQQ